jgi:hypothetical protein
MTKSRKKSRGSGVSSKERFTREVIPEGHVLVVANAEGAARMETLDPPGEAVKETD